MLRSSKRSYMKGVVTDYFEKKGFGFLRDEEHNKRFFHISAIRNKTQFLENLEDYYFTDWCERKLVAMDFSPMMDEKGPIAKSITLTDERVNDKTDKLPFAARIVDIEHCKDSLTRITSGVKKGQPAPFGATAGGNGTYRLGYPETINNLFVHFHRNDFIGWGNIEVRALALKMNGRSNITESFVESLQINLIGRTIEVFAQNGEWVLMDSSALKF